MLDITQKEAQSKDLSYPEGAWIGVCGYYLPSEVQWLYKNFTKQKLNSTVVIPEIATTSYHNDLNDDYSTLGSGKTTNGVYIHEKISIDWLRYAIQKRMWKLLYNNGKIGSTSTGIDFFKNELITVLKIAVDNNIISSYEIQSVVLDRVANKIAMKFSAELTHTIFSVAVTGSLYK